MDDGREKTGSDKTSLLGADAGTLEEQKKRAQGTTACFLIISGEPLGRIFSLKPGLNSVGRDPTNDIVLEDKYVSSRHGQFTIQQDRILFQDLGSSNGSFIHDQKIETGVLMDGEHIRIGKTVLKYLAQGNAENIYAGQMYDYANMDDLTKIHNKKYFLEEIQKEFKRCRIRGGKFCVIMFDIDFFKKVNDTYGHPAGDYVLRKTCDILKETVLRHRDIFARYGGEEFILLLFDTTPEKACQVAERMRQTIEKTHFEHQDQVIPLTISLGVAMYDHKLTAVEEILETADQNLYRSKKTGRNRVSFS